MTTENLTKSSTKNSVQDIQSLIQSIPDRHFDVQGPDDTSITLTASLRLALDDDDGVEFASVFVDVYVFCGYRRSVLFHILEPDAEQISECNWEMRQGDCGEGAVPFEAGELQTKGLEDLRADLVEVMDLFLTSYAETALRVHEGDMDEYLKLYNEGGPAVYPAGYDEGNDD